MKKLMVFAMAAMVALASCTKTELVDNSAPTPISFKAVTGSMTKAEQTSNLFTQTLGVFAIENENNKPYFSNYAFNPNNDKTEWTNTGLYWPIQTTLDFVVYSPAVTGTDASFDGTILTVSSNDNVPTPVSNTYSASITDQKDLLFGDKYYDNDAKGFGYNTNYEAVSTNMKHALTKITLEFNCTNAEVQSVAVENPCMSGIYKVDYSKKPLKAEWTTATPLGDNTKLNLTGIEESKVSIMVVPSNVRDFLITYSIGDFDNVFPAKIDLDNNAKWEPGNHYIYEIGISPKGIVFAKPTVSGWDNTIESENNSLVEE